MLLYNILLNTKAGSRAYLKNQDKDKATVNGNVCTAIEIGLFAIIAAFVLMWAVDNMTGLIILPFAAGFFGLYVMTKFTFGSPEHTSYLERRASLGLDPNEDSLYHDNGELKTGWFGKRKNEKIVKESTFDIDEEVLMQWSKELDEKEARGN